MASEWVREGLKYVLQVSFSEEDTVPANFYLALISDTGVAETDAWSDWTEIETPGSNGYNRQTVATSDVGFTVSDITGADVIATTLTQTFTCSGVGWKTAGAVAMIMSDVGGDGGITMAAADLGTARSLTTGDSLQVAMQLELEG
ncbi:hypothetical protein LCGC14_0235870 [marine sediment metagenome]|uniref:Uncharacterized protein n=1 Tax=marine sediment metagenome TaxID=412755 RepID=A0A0F9WTU1_9ZZZZ